MEFNSFLFVGVFLPVFLAGYYILRATVGGKGPQAWILVSSLAFYGLANPKYLPLLAGSIIFNYWIGKRLAINSGREIAYRWLKIGLVVNVALLCFFKYTGFFLSTVGTVMRANVLLPDWRFPLGISFFTLQQVMYLVDCYEGLIESNSLFNHATFVSFFPYVISGPITRARSVVGQFAHTAAASESIAQGIRLFTFGLAKKVILADSFARFADAGFSHPSAASTLEAWISSLAYTFQMYFDFSGYTDMALGVALMIGIALPINFRAPYRSTSVIEFWQRWHITLSQFITTYLYTPMLRGRGRVTLLRASVATLLAMTIAGLWHGPSWTFLVWGAMHGLALVVNQYWRKRVKKQIPTMIGWALTFAFVSSTLVVFRSETLASALEMLRALGPQHNLIGLSLFHDSIRRSELELFAIPIGLGIALAFWGPTSQDAAKRLHPTLASAVAVASLAFVALLFMNSILAKQFIYFAF